MIDAVLRPGDALYLPRGYLHAAEALGEVSCHLTVGVHPVTRHQVLESLVAIVADDPALRASLPMGIDVGDPAAVEADVRETVAALVDRLGSVTAADVATRLGRRVVGSNRPAPVARQAAALAALDLESVLVARDHQRHLVTADGDDVVVRLPDRALRLPAAAGKAVRALLDGEALRVADLPGLDADDAPGLLARRARGGRRGRRPAERSPCPRRSPGERGERPAGTGTAVRRRGAASRGPDGRHCCAGRWLSCSIE